MGWFRKNVLPRTSYGYRPPADAITVGWRCFTDGCHRSDEPAPRRWPAFCDGCGEEVDPVFAPPWAHDARRFEIDFVLAAPDESEVLKTLYRVESEVWNYTDALLRGAHGRASAARGALRALTVELTRADRHFVAGTGFMKVVTTGLAEGDTDGVGEELLAWYPTVDTDDVENNNGQRTTSRQFVASCVEFLENPHGARHHYSGELFAAMLDVAQRARNVLTMDNENGIERVRRSRFSTR